MPKLFLIQQVMPDLVKTLLVGNLFLPGATVTAVMVSGHTISQMPFAGELASADDGIITLSQKESGNEQMGIPIDEIQNLRLDVSGISATALEGLFRYPAILHLWDGVIHERLVGHVEKLAEEEKWTDCYHCSTVLETGIFRQDLGNRIQLAKAWALFEMGLYKQSEAIIRSHEKTGHTTNPTTRYCWLRTKLALLEKDFEMATYWALLPMLRIPSDTSELAVQLYTECESWQKGL